LDAKTAPQGGRYCKRFCRFVEWRANALPVALPLLAADRRSDSPVALTEAQTEAEARFRLGTLHLARARPLPGLRLVFRRRLQPRPLRPAQAKLTAPRSCTAPPRRPATIAGSSPHLNVAPATAIPALATATPDGYRRKYRNPLARPTAVLVKKTSVYGRALIYTLCHNRRRT